MSVLGVVAGVFALLVVFWLLLELKLDRILESCDDLLKGVSSDVKLKCLESRVKDLEQTVSTLYDIAFEKNVEELREKHGLNHKENEDGK